MRTKCLANLRGIGQMVVMYENMFRGNIPIGFNVGSGTNAGKVLGNNYGLAYRENADHASGTSAWACCIPLASSARAATRRESEGEMFYCPSMSDEYEPHSFNARTNPWISSLLAPAPDRRCAAAGTARARQPDERQADRLARAAPVGFSQSGSGCDVCHDVRRHRERSCRSP